MQTHGVHFNGAGEEELPLISQAWSIAHTDEETRRANRETIAGIAAILREYPNLNIAVHGETGSASTAPRPLADHLRLHYMHDRHDIMEQLARLRAQACFDALVAQGVPESQLSITYHGRSDQTKVDFLPDGFLAETIGGAEHANVTHVSVPLPTGIPCVRTHTFTPTFNERANPGDEARAICTVQVRAAIGEGRRCYHGRHHFFDRARSLLQAASQREASRWPNIRVRGFRGCWHGAQRVRVHHQP